MATALIISVGGSMEPVVYSIRQRAPDYVCFLASQRSMDLIAEIKRASSQTAPDRKIIVDDAEDLAHCYEKALECFDWVEHQHPGCLTIVDVTGGTKAMSAALAIAAVARRQLLLRRRRAARPRRDGCGRNRQRASARIGQSMGVVRG